MPAAAAATPWATNQRRRLLRAGHRVEHDPDRLAVRAFRSCSAQHPARVGLVDEVRHHREVAEVQSAPPTLGQVVLERLHLVGIEDAEHVGGDVEVIWCRCHRDSPRSCNARRKRTKRVVHPRLDRSRRHTQCRRGLTDSAIPQICLENSLPMLLGETVHRLGDDDRREGAILFAAGGRLVRRGQFELLRTDASLSSVVDDQPPCHREQPRSQEHGVALEFFGVAPCPDQGLLHDVLGPLTIMARQPHAVSQQGTAEFLVQPTDQLFLERSPVLVIVRSYLTRVECVYAAPRGTSLPHQPSQVERQIFLTKFVNRCRIVSVLLGTSPRKDPSRCDVDRPSPLWRPWLSPSPRAAAAPRPRPPREAARAACRRTRLT